MDKELDQPEEGEYDELISEINKIVKTQNAEVKKEIKQINDNVSKIQTDLVGL